MLPRSIPSKRVEPVDFGTLAYIINWISTIADKKPDFCSTLHTKYKRIVFCRSNEWPPEFFGVSRITQWTYCIEIVPRPIKLGVHQTRVQKKLLKTHLQNTWRELARSAKTDRVKNPIWEIWKGVWKQEMTAKAKSLSMWNHLSTRGHPHMCDHLRPEKNTFNTTGEDQEQ